MGEPGAAGKSIGTCWLRVETGRFVQARRPVSFFLRTESGEWPAAICSPSKRKTWIKLGMSG